MYTYLNFRKNIYDVIRFMDDKAKNKVQQVIEADNNIDENIKSDINGSYTGRPLNGRHPIQDADDL